MVDPIGSATAATLETAFMRRSAGPAYHGEHVLMPTRLRQLALTVHVVASVGWIGAVATFLALAVVGRYTADPEKARSCYVAMEIATRTIILPLAIACVATGFVQSLGTRWGLFRHYWVVTKMVIAVISTGLLALHMRPIAIAADAAAARQLFEPALLGVRSQLVLDASLAIIALVVATVLSIYKPAGLTAYGRRHEGRERPLGTPSVPWSFLMLLGILILVGVAIGVHLAGGGLHSH